MAGCIERKFLSTSILTPLTNQESEFDTDISKLIQNEIRIVYKIRVLMLNSF